MFLFGAFPAQLLLSLSFSTDRAFCTACWMPLVKSAGGSPAGCAQVCVASFDSSGQVGCGSAFPLSSVLASFCRDPLVRLSLAVCAQSSAAWDSALLPMGNRLAVVSPLCCPSFGDSVAGGVCRAAFPLAGVPFLWWFPMAVGSSPRAASCIVSCGDGNPYLVMLIHRRCPCSWFAAR